ncbi:basic leucine zipper transcriptional factor ATF-like 3 isoform X2 [Pongo pygmaeus]|uniref:basic leucine zipper transcriptional factor ATF-like 3 isoform X2 n=1 Tax=Pongo pygmaeus TaxID=9600 RepID=UPI00300C8A13
MGPGKTHRPQNTHCVSQPEFPSSGRRTPKAAWRPRGPHPPGRRLAWVGFAFPPGFQSHHVTSTKRGAPAESRGRGGIWDPESPEDDDRKVRRREKNRVAAQRSRKKQTQKADKLHEAQGESSAAWAQHRRGHCHTFALGMVSRTMHCILGATFSEIFW